METGIIVFLAFVFLTLTVLTVSSIVYYVFFCPKDEENTGAEPVIYGEPDRPAPLIAGNDDWNSGFGEEGAGKKRRKPVRGFRDRLFKDIIVLVTLDVLFVAVVICFAAGIIGTDYRKNEKLNDGEYEWFEETDYSIIGDGVIYDEGGIRITVSGIYDVPGLVPGEDPWPAGAVKVGFIVENYSGKNVDIRVTCNSINGVATSLSYFYMMGNFKKNTTTQVYEDIYAYIPGNDISQMVIDDVLIYSLKYEWIAEAADPVFINTTAEVTVPDPDLTGYHPIFENDAFEIYACENTDRFHEGYTLYIENRSGMNYTVDIEGMAVDGKGVTGEGIYDSLIPAGNIMYTSQIYSYDSAYDTASPYKREVMISLSFKCLDDEEESFSTGYMPLN